MAETRVVNLEVKDNTKSLKLQLKEAQQEVQKLADKYGATSQQAIQAAKRAAELKDRIGDAKALTDAFNPDAKFKALSSSLSGVAGGFSAVTGAMGLLGAESEDVQKLMLKVQSAMAISQGLQALGEARDSFKQLGAVVQDFIGKLFTKNTAEATGLVTTEASVVATEAQVVATEAEAVATGEATVAQEGLNTAMAMNPIGAVVAVLAALTAGLVYYFSVAGGASEASKKMAEQKKQAAKAAEEQREAVSKESTQFVGLIYQLKATNANSKERADLIKKINSTYGTTLKNISDETAFQKQLNGEVANYIAYQKAKYELQKNEKLVTENLKNQDKIRGDIAKAQLAYDRALADQKKASKFTDFQGTGAIDLAVENARVSLIKQQQLLADAEKRLEAYGATSLKANEAITQIEGSTNKYNTSLQTQGTTTKKVTDEISEYQKALNDYLDAVEADRQNRIKDAQEKELQDLANKYDQMTLLADKAKEDDTAITAQYQKDILAIKDKYRQIEIDKQNEANKKAHDFEKKHNQEYQDEIAALQEDNYQATLTAEQREVRAVNDKYFTLQELAKGNAEELAIVEEAKENEIQKIQEKYADAEKKRKEDRLKNDLDLAKSGFDTIANLTELFGKKGEASARRAFNVKKAAQIASATIDTYQSATAAYASQFVPVPDPSSPVRGGIAAGIAVAAGLINIGKIAAQKFEGTSTTGGGGGGGGGGGLGGGGVTAPNFNVVGNNNINQLAQLQQQPIKAYVVGAEVTTQQSLDRNRLKTGQL